MIVKRTEQIHIEKNEKISYMCHLSKNLFNQTNYVLRQQFFNKERQTGYKSLVKSFQKPSEEDENNNYQKLPSKTAQWTIKMTKQAWSSYYKAMKEYKKHPDDFTGMPGIPKYKDKDSEYILMFTNQQCYIENGVLEFPKIMNLEVKTRLDDNIKLKEARIIPQSVGYNVEIVYDKEVSNINKNTERILGIDIGVTNLVTIGNNFSEKGIAIKAGLLKSINQYFNKELSRLKSINDLQDKNKYKKNTKKINKLYTIRNRKIKDIMHKLSKIIIEYAYNLNVDTIIIGHNDGWKDSVNLGKRNNQNFVQLPFNTLIEQIKYKAEEYRINVILHEESYTSKASFLDNETIEYHDIYMGKRIERGIFRSSKGTLIHADLQASYNIIKKAIPDAFANGIEGIGLYPRSLSIKKMITSKGGC